MSLILTWIATVRLLDNYSRELRRAIRRKLWMGRGMEGSQFYRASSISPEVNVCHY
jgi:hypothetical protein